VQLSVVTVTYNEQENIGRALASVAPLVAGGSGETIVLDCGSTDRTLEIARQHGATVFLEPWQGFAAQKNSAIRKARGDWVLLLDADEAADDELVQQIARIVNGTSAQPAPGRVSPPAGAMPQPPAGFFIRRKNYFLGRWIRHGGFWPDPKLRLFRPGAGQVEDRAVHETVQVQGSTLLLPHGALIHSSYPTLRDYIEHMNRYSSLGAEMAGPLPFSLLRIVFRPLATFLYNYFFRLGFMDGREGLLLHMYHAVYVSWKYAKSWEAGRGR
jgi:glycosyltransferase involved in cell wall biosynthesis